MQREASPKRRATRGGLAMRRVLLVLVLVSSLATGCNRMGKSVGGPKDVLVGRWSGVYTNPSGPTSTIPFEFDFGGDGSFRMGQRKVWVTGTYQFTGPTTFATKI